MDSIPSSPIKIQNASRCEQLQQDPALQGLEHFWNQEILHRQHEPQHHFSSSLEKQFLYDDYLTNPIPQERKQRKVHRQNKSEQRRVVRGEELNDIPTTYLISGLQRHELPVIGTYVDSAVLPGFRYKVRLNQTHQKHLFGGQALRLLSVGPGYGKRLSFQGNSALNNRNYFWSDSHPEGYGFALEVVSKGDKFVVKDPVGGRSKGIAEVVRFATPQYELQTSVMSDGSIHKTVFVDVWCEYLHVDDERKSVTEIRIEGVAVVMKLKGPDCVAEVKGISVHRHTMKGLELFPITH